MNKSLALLALLAISTLAGSALAETAGLHVPALISGETTLGLFVAAFALLMVRAEYGGVRSLDSRRSPVRLYPAAEAFATVVSYRGRRTRRVVRALVSN